MVDRRDDPSIDRYAQLGVRPDASPTDIDTAYRRLARALHPDSAHPDAVNVERLQRVLEAHAVLSDPERRREYDEGRSRTVSQRSAPTPCPVCRGTRTIISPCVCLATRGRTPALFLGPTSRWCAICRGTGRRPVVCGACAGTGYTT